MHGLSIFCHFWQIADHTHIFSLPLPHKLWLHMGKHSLPQECNKLQRMPHTHSRDSRTESPPMVSNPVPSVVGSERAALCVHVSQEWCLKTVTSGHFRNWNHLLCLNSSLGLFWMSLVRSGGYLSWGQRWQIDRTVPMPSCSHFSPIYSSTSNLPLEPLVLESKVFWCLIAIKLRWMDSLGVKIHFLCIRCLPMTREVQTEFHKPLLWAWGW